jgi:hypothetical protein
MMPNNTLSVTPIVAPFQAPRGALRSLAADGLSDLHFGGVALGDPSQGLTFQLWRVSAKSDGIYLAAPNTPSFKILDIRAAVWVALSFDQNARPFIAWVADESGTANFYWFDTTINNFRITTLAGPIFRIFATLDDPRPVEIQNGDIILAYVRSGNLFTRVQRERFGVEHSFGIAPGSLVQLGLNLKLRLQFAFQNAGDRLLPPQEYSPSLGVNEPA